MRIIKQLAEDIECNIREAREKITTAYSLRAKFPNEAAWYRDMAVAHLDFSTKGHELVASEIAQYKASSGYAEKPQYAEGMVAVWEDKHNDLIVQTAEVRAMIAAFK